MQRSEDAKSSLVAAHVTIYIYEDVGLAIRDRASRVSRHAVVGAWLMVETQVAAATGLASQNLSVALLAKVEELVWPT